MKLLIPSARSYAALVVLAVLLPVPAAVAQTPVTEPFYPADLDAPKLARSSNGSTRHATRASAPSPR